MKIIENVNYSSFLKYGAIEHKGFDYAVNSQVNSSSYVISQQTVSFREFSSLFVHEENVVLDIVSGVSLIYLTVSPEEDGLFFLLDKTVIINSGIFFNIISLYGNCRYQTASMDNGETVLLYSPIIGPLGLSSNINISKIHTLFYQEKEKGFSFKGEAHDFLELTYVDKGKMYTSINEEVFFLQQGDAVFYNRGEYHTQWSEQDLSVSFVTVTFDMDSPDSSLFNKIHSIDNEMKKLLGKIILEKESNLLYSEDLILGYLKEFIIRLIRSSLLENTIIQQDSDIRTRIDNSIVARCVDYIKINAENRISVPDVARTIPISPSYLSQIFRKKTGVTVIDFINNYKLEKSKEYIKTSSLNFTQISEKLGYTSVHYFSRQFKGKYGISPSEYARSINR